jgi:hypothetical protein
MLRLLRLFRWRLGFLAWLLRFSGLWLFLRAGLVNLGSSWLLARIAADANVEE